VGEQRARAPLLLLALSAASPSFSLPLPSPPFPLLTPPPSQCWDTSFAIQGIHEAGLLDEFPEVATLCYSFFEKTQILETPVAQGTAAFKFEASKVRVLSVCFRITIMRF